LACNGNWETHGKKKETSSSLHIWRDGRLPPGRGRPTTSGRPNDFARVGKEDRAMRRRGGRSAAAPCTNSGRCRGDGGRGDPPSRVEGERGFRLRRPWMQRAQLYRGRRSRKRAGEQGRSLGSSAGEHTSRGRAGAAPAHHNTRPPAASAHPPWSSGAGEGCCGPATPASDPPCSVASDPPQELFPPPQ
jgi:hypothetical protein